jgi:hypothetical protein
MNLFPTYIFIVLLLVACNSSTSVQSKQDCDSLRNGRFFYRSELSGNTYAITRKDDLQTEVNEMTREVSRWKITWTGPCQFESKSLDNSVKYPDPIKFEIVKHTTEYYIFEARRVGSDRLISDTLFKIH